VAIQCELGDRTTIESVTAATIYLASNQCSISGHSISAVAGRYARIFTAVTDGWLRPDVANVSPEEFRDNLAQILDRSSLLEVKSMSDEYAGVLERVAALAQNKT
jgi:hypothetical protein